MPVARVIEPASKLATERQLHDDTASSSLGRVLGVGQCSADDLYRALDWLHHAQGAIEKRLAHQNLVGSPWRRPRVNKRRPCRRRSPGPRQCREDCSCCRRCPC